MKGCVQNGTPFETEQISVSGGSRTRDRSIRRSALNLLSHRGSSKLIGRYTNAQMNARFVQQRLF